MMKLFQMLVFTAVAFSNIRWQWTPNGYLASMIGGGVAYLATLAVVSVGDLLRRLKRPEVRPPVRFARQHRVYQGAFPPALPRR